MAAQAVSTGAISEVAPWLSPIVPLKNGASVAHSNLLDTTPFMGSFPSLSHHLSHPLPVPPGSSPQINYFP